MHTLFVSCLSNYLINTYLLVPGQLINILVVSGSILVGFDLAASNLPGAPLQETVIVALEAAIQSGNIDIGYPFPIKVDQVCCKYNCVFLALYVTPLHQNSFQTASTAEASTGMAAGSVVGIVIAVIIAVVLLIGGVAYALNRSRSKAKLSGRPSVSAAHVMVRT